MGSRILNLVCFCLQNYTLRVVFRKLKTPGGRCRAEHVLRRSRAPRGRFPRARTRRPTGPERGSVSPASPPGIERFGSAAGSVCNSMSMVRHVTVRLRGCRADAVQTAGIPDTSAVDHGLSPPLITRGNHSHRTKSVERQFVHKKLRRCVFRGRREALPAADMRVKPCVRRQKTPNFSGVRAETWTRLAARAWRAAQPTGALLSRELIVRRLLCRS